MRISESQLRREIRSVITESWREHSSHASDEQSVSSNDQMLASGYGSKVFHGEKITFEDFELRIELDSKAGLNVDHALIPIRMQSGEVVKSDKVTGVIVAKFPFIIGDINDNRFQSHPLVAKNIALWLSK